MKKFIIIIILILFICANTSLKPYTFDMLFMASLYFWTKRQADNTEDEIEKTLFGLRLIGAFFAYIGLSMTISAKFFHKSVETWNGRSNRATTALYEQDAINYGLFILGIGVFILIVFYVLKNIHDKQK